MADYLGGLSGLADLYGQYQSYQNANNAANTISGIGTASNNAYQTQLQSLQNQSLAGAGMRDNVMADARGAANASYGSLFNGINAMTGQLNSLNDPNSAYMQQARQAIERKDAASGRRSQWGEREVQLAGNLAQQYNQYAPGLQNAITAANGQIGTNFQGLGSLYNNMNSAVNNSNTNMTSLINQGGQNQVALANATMGAMNNANNQQNGMANGLIGAIPGVIKGIGSLWDAGSNWFGASEQGGDALGDFGSSEGWW